MNSHGNGSRATQCCLPSVPCGNLVCSRARDWEECRALARAASPVQIDAVKCARELQRLPDWGEVTWPFVYAPAAMLLGAASLWTILSRVYAVLMRRSEAFNKTMLNNVGNVLHQYPKNPSFLTGVHAAQIVGSMCTMVIFVFNTYQRSLLPAVAWTETGMALIMLSFYVIYGLRHEFSLFSLLHLGPLVDALTLPSMLLAAIADPATAEVHWVSLSFLRLVQALLSYEELNRLGAVRLGEVAHDISRLALRFLTLVACSASSVLIIETLGELPDVPGAGDATLISTGMGDISFFTMVYWIIETMSTVGYGDYAPTTILSRLVTICCMLAGVVFFTMQLDKILSVLSRQKKGAGSYLPGADGTGHVVLVGGGVQKRDEVLLQAFLQEMYHKSYRNSWPELVVMSSSVGSMEKMREIVEMQLEWQAKQHIHFLVGSSLSLADLERCRCDIAKLVFVIADTTGSSDPHEEDKENILRALSVKNSFPNIPMRLMLLMQDSKDRAVQVGVRRQRCFSVFEMRSSLFWQACRCKGWNTLLCNLMETRDLDEFESGKDKDEEWLEEYILGMGHEVYGFLPGPDLRGRSFQEVVCDAYSRFDMLILAAQIRGRVVLAPLQHLDPVVIQDRMVLFALAEEEDVLKHVAMDNKEVDWKKVFLENRLQMYTEEDAKNLALSQGFRLVSQAVDQTMDPRLVSSAQSTLALSRAQTTPAPSRGNSSKATLEVPAIRSENSWQEPLEMEVSYDETFTSCGTCCAGMTPSGVPETSTSSNGQLVSNQGLVVVQTSPVFGANQGAGQVGAEDKLPEQAQPQPAPVGSRTERRLERQKARMRAALPRSNASALDAQSQQTMTTKMVRRLKSIKEDAQRSPFVLLLVLGQHSWWPVVSFVKHSRADYLPFVVPIIMLCRELPPKDVADVLDLSIDPQLAVAVGHPNWAPDLLRAGARECHTIVCLGQDVKGQSHFGGELVAMLDADVVMLQRMLERVGLADKAAVFEFERAQNIRLLPSLGRSDLVSPTRQLSSMSSASHLAAAREFGRRDSVQRKAFERSVTMAAGRCGLCCRRNEAPSEGAAALGQVYLDPRLTSGEVFTAQPLGALLAQAYHTPGVLEVMQALIVPDDSNGSKKPWQLRLRPDQVGAAYSDVFLECVQQLGVLPMGLLRTTAAHDKPYVWTNPGPDVLLRGDDLLFVLGDTDFGNSAFGSGLLPMSGKAWEDSNDDDVLS